VKSEKVNEESQDHFIFDDVVAYTAFSTILKAQKLTGHFADFEWWKGLGLVGSLDLLKFNRDFIYGQMVEDFATELANSVNKLTNSVDRLRAWDAVCSNQDEDNRFYTFVEFVDNEGAVALNLPAIIKSRFIYAATHLSHQANSFKHRLTWKDELPAKLRSVKILEKNADSWNNLKAFLDALKEINSEEFINTTSNFRNDYQHNMPRGIGYGFSGVRRVSCNKKDGRVTYSLGSTPLQLSTIIRLLEAQASATLNAFDAFKLLIVEQVKFIRQLETGHDGSRDGKV
jgi:hypothetical protein